MKRPLLTLAVMAVVGVLSLVALGGCGGSSHAPNALDDETVLASEDITEADPVEATSDSAEAVTFGTNLIKNPAAEADTGGNGYVDVPPSRWTRTGALTVVKYGAGGGLPGVASPGPPSRGLNFFAGGPNSALSKGTQTASISWAAPVIDAGHAQYLVVGFLGGYSSHTDNARVKLTFRNAGGASLGTAIIGPVTPAQRGNVTGLLRRSRKGPVPPGTRSIRTELILTRGTTSSYNDGYADALLLRLSDVTP